MNDVINLNNVDYKLNQCMDIWDWFNTSNVGEYTHYYSNLVFHTPYGFYCAWPDDLENWFKI